MNTGLYHPTRAEESLAVASSLSGLTITKAKRIPPGATTERAQYALEVNGKPIVFRRIGHLVHQSTFRTTIELACEVSPKPLRCGLWHAVVQLILDASDEQE